jgi:hypothetical protein
MNRKRNHGCLISEVSPWYANSVAGVRCLVPYAI